MSLHQQLPTLALVREGLVSHHTERKVVAILHRQSMTFTDRRHSSCGSTSWEDSFVFKADIAVISSCRFQMREIVTAVELRRYNRSDGTRR